MNVVCFKVYDTNCQAAPLPSLSSLELIFLPSFFPTPFQLLHSSENSYYQAPVLKEMSNCWTELSSVERPYQSTSVCNRDKLALWFLSACSWSWKWALGCLSWLPHKFIVRINWNSVWSGLNMGINYWHVREQSCYKVHIDPTPWWDFTNYLSWKPSKYKKKP